MKHRARFTFLMLAAVSISIGCEKSQPAPMNVAADRDMLVGAWRSKIVFRSGSLAEMKDLEFLYSYNAGGTMTESSNYDEASNSTPPAYGVWKQIAPQRFQTKYVYYTTQKAGPEVGAGNTDWWPAGHGVLTETITLSADGQTYTSTIKLSIYDRAGAPIAGSGEGTGAGTRIVF